jgi:hypothetical protein
MLPIQSPVTCRTHHSPTDVETDDSPARTDAITKGGKVVPVATPYFENPLPRCQVERLNRPSAERVFPTEKRNTIEDIE